jgi:hypothetical protein
VERSENQVTSLNYHEIFSRFFPNIFHTSDLSLSTHSGIEKHCVEENKHLNTAD